MAKKRSHLSWILLLPIGLASASLVYFNSCTATDESHASEKNTTGLREQDVLRVISATPQGAVEDIGQFYSVVVVFNQAMVPLEALPEGDGSGPLQLTPHVKGKYRWLGTNTLAFIPADTLTLATRYSVTVPAGTRSLAGNALDRPYTWSFETLKPAFKRSNVYPDASGVTRNPTVYLLFNQPVVLSSLRQRVTLFKESDGSKVPITVSQADTDQVREYREKYAYSYYDYGYEEAGSVPDVASCLYTAKVVGPLEMATTYVLEVGADIRGIVGELGSSESKQIRFTTYGPLKLLGVEDPEYPSWPLKVRFSNYVNPSQMAAHAEISPEAELKDAYSMYWEDNTVGLAYDLKPQTRYRLTLSSKLEDNLGNTLGETYVHTFTTGDYESAVYFPSGDHIIESYLSHNLNVTVINPRPISLRMGKLSQTDVIRLIQVGYQWSDKEVFSGWTVQKTGIPPLARNQVHLVPIDLDGALGSERSGAVYVEMKHGEEKSVETRRAIVQLTDIGITAKFSKLDNLICLTSLRDGRPLNGAYVEIRDDDATVRWSGQTDARGFARAPGWFALGIRPENEWSEPRQWVFAGYGDQRAFAHSGDRVSTYRFNVDYNWSVSEKDRTDGFLFTNQGIYRPGDKVFIKGLCRTIRNDVLTVAARQTVQLLIRNPSYEEILQESIVTNDFGAFDLPFAVDANASLGHYSIQASVGGETIASESFQVQEFKPVEMEVAVTSDRTHYVCGEKLKATLDGHYLFGMPLGQNPIRWSITRTRASYEPPGYDGYYFGENLYDDYRWSGQYSYSNVLASNTGTLDNRGLLDVSLDLVADGRNETSTLVIEGTVQDKSRQSVSGRKSVWVHAGTYYIGLKPSTTFHESGKPLAVDVVTVDPEGKKSGGHPLAMQLIRRSWVSVREKSSDGTYQWTSQQFDSVESEIRFTSTRESLSRTVNPSATGYYLVRVSGTDEHGNTVQSTCYVYVVGRGYAGWYMSNDDKIDLVPSKTSYNPGDKARILVKSPYDECQALVTVERDGILSHQTVQLKGSSDVVDLAVSKDWIPNVYVSVLLLKGRSALPEPGQKEDIGKPSFKVGYTKLAVNPDANRLNVGIKTERDKYGPGEWVTVDLSVKNRSGHGSTAEVTLYVEDIGVLNLVGYRTPQPFDHFYQHRPLSVATTETRSYILDQVVEKEFTEKGGVGGGGGDEAYPAIAIRKDFKACVYWNPSVVTDASGKARVRFQLPDNLTGFKILAVAHSGDSRFGSSEKNITVAKPLMLRPALPRFARVGDEVEAGVIVHNYADRDGTVKVMAALEGVDLQDQASRDVTLKRGTSEEVRYKFKVRESRTGVFTFRAVMDDLSDGVEIRLPLKIPTYTETVALYGSTVTSHREEVVVPSAIFENVGGLDVTTSSTALVDLDGSVRYLFEYPYGCLEQKTSRVLPIILFGDVVAAFGWQAFREGSGTMEEVVQQYLDDVPKYQDYGGGFKYWTDGDHVSPYVSVYAMFALHKAKQKGYAVSEDCYSKGLSYLKQLVRSRGVDRYGLFYSHVTNCFALAMLAETGYYDAPTVELMFQRRQELPLYARAMLLKAIVLGRGNPVMADELKRDMQNAIKMNATGAHFEEPATQGLEWTFHSNIRTTAAVLLTFLEVDGESVPWAEKVVKYVLQERKLGRWRSTQENVYVFWALATYFSIFEKDVPDFTSDILVDGKNLLHEIFRGRTTASGRKLMSLAELQKDVRLPVDIKKKGAGRLYYSLRMTYAPLAGAVIQARDEGLRVEKTIEDESGQLVTTGVFKAGSLYRVKLTVRTPQDRHFVVVDDPLPAGFEAVNVQLATSGQGLTSLVSAPRRGWWFYSGFNTSELRDDRVLLFADFLNQGSHTYTYLVQATSYGTFELPPTKAEEMYAPEVFGSTQNRLIRVQ